VYVKTKDNLEIHHDVELLAGWISMVVVFILIVGPRHIKVSAEAVSIKGCNCGEDSLQKWSLRMPM
jgi:hypothetical protein